MTNKEQFKQVFNNVKVFSCGIGTQDSADSNNKSRNTNYNGFVAYSFTGSTAFPVSKLVTGGVSSRFLGIIPTNKREKTSKDIFF